MEQTEDDIKARLSELAAKPTLSVAERIERWRLEEGGTETEGEIELLCDAEEALKAYEAAHV